MVNLYHILVTQLHILEKYFIDNAWMKSWVNIIISECILIYFPILKIIERNKIPCVGYIIFHGYEYNNCPPLYLSLNMAQSFTYISVI